MKLVILILQLKFHQVLSHLYYFIRDQCLLIEEIYIYFKVFLWSRSYLIGSVLNELTQVDRFYRNFGISHHRYLTTLILYIIYYPAYLG